MAAFLDAIEQRSDLPGPVVELGCLRGGTTIAVHRTLSRIGRPRDYWCIDTFGGFVPDQAAADRDLGLPAGHARYFRDNSRRRVERTLARFGLGHVRMVEADICTLPPDALPTDISLALIDVDLHAPVLAGLEKIVPRLAPGGVVLVDDCRIGTPWVGADVAYRDYVVASGLPARYFAGFGVIERPGPMSPLTWPTLDVPQVVRERWTATLVAALSQ